MIRISSPSEFQKYCEHQRALGKTLGFVPTMGALHEGHISLVREAQKQTDITIVSIFVNPTQFNNPDDFLKYPNTLQMDLQLLEQLQVDVVFTPKAEDMYADNKVFTINESTHHLELCGKTRPGHFNGVLTIVMKLLLLSQAQKVFMGEKDFQQLHLIQQMVKAFFVPTKIIGCPTVRDSKGLALSSRNKRLDQKGLELAHIFAKALKQGKTLEQVQSQLSKNNIKVDYLEEKYGRRFAAVFIDDVRLIDNVAL